MFHFFENQYPSRNFPLLQSFPLLFHLPLLLSLAFFCAPSSSDAPVFFFEGGLNYASKAAAHSASFTLQHAFKNACPRPYVSFQQFLADSEKPPRVFWVIASRLAFWEFFCWRGWNKQSKSKSVHPLAYIPGASPHGTCKLVKKSKTTYSKTRATVIITLNTREIIVTPSGHQHANNASPAHEYQSTAPYATKPSLELCKGSGQQSRRSKSCGKFYAETTTEVTIESATEDGRLGRASLRGRSFDC